MIEYDSRFTLKVLQQEWGQIFEGLGYLLWWLLRHLRSLPSSSPDSTLSTFRRKIKDWCWRHFCCGRFCWLDREFAHLSTVICRMSQKFSSHDGCDNSVSRQLRDVQMLPKSSYYTMIDTISTIEVSTARSLHLLCKLLEWAHYDNAFILGQNDGMQAFNSWHVKLPLILTAGCNGKPFEPRFWKCWRNLARSGHSLTFLRVFSWRHFWQLWKSCVMRSSAKEAVCNLNFAQLARPPKPFQSFLVSQISLIPSDYIIDNWRDSNTWYIDRHQTYAYDNSKGKRLVHRHLHIALNASVCLQNCMSMWWLCVFLPKFSCRAARQLQCARRSKPYVTSGTPPRSHVNSLPKTLIYRAASE